MNCHICKQPLTSASKPRKNTYLSATCQTCKLQHSFWLGELGSIPALSWVSKRFSHNQTTWHMTYRPDKDQTRFSVVKKRTQQEKVEGPAREEYTFDTLVLPNRFIDLIVYL